MNNLTRRFITSAALNCDKYKGILIFVILQASKILFQYHSILNNKCTYCTVKHSKKCITFLLSTISQWNIVDMIITYDKYSAYDYSYALVTQQIVTQKARTIYDRKYIYETIKSPSAFYWILALSLFVSRIFTDYSDTSFSLNNFAFFANWFY